MSHISNHTIQCPSCHCEQECQAYRSVNISLDPTLRERLLDGTLNQFVCEKCNFDAQLGVASFIYHDMRQKLWLQYFQSEEMSKSSQKMLATMSKNQGYTVHIYFDFGDLVAAVAQLDS